MSEPNQQAAGTVETPQEALKSPVEFVKHWLQAIELAGSEEETWRKQARTTLKRYAETKGQSFNILYANTQTTVPALYNSEPVPDIRRRFGDDDPVGKNASDMLERMISVQCELYDFDGCMKAAVKDRQLSGRGISRVRVVTGDNGSKHIECEPVIWEDYRHGPAKTRKDVPWEAFRHRMTREELVALSPTVGPKVKLEAVVDGAAKDEKSGKALPDMFKRAEVWEIWHKAERKVYVIAVSFPDGPVKVLNDPYQLREFFCTPKPLYAVEQTDSLTPVCEFMLWKPLADEMDDLTKRIAGIVKVMKLRGLYAGQFENLIEKMGRLEDGELAAADDSARTMQEGGIDKAIWLWPVDVAIKVVEGLYVARDAAKASIYEITGVADILRGQTDPDETLGAQQIKAQWGSLRLQDAQKDVQRYARELFRMMADLSCQEMEMAEMSAMTGISFQPPPPPQIPPETPPEQAQQAAQQYQQAVMQAQQMAQAVEQLLKGPDLQREFAIEIETDSTIRADLSRAQQNVAGFVTGLGQFMESVGPAVQAQMMPPEIAVKFIGAFARNFKLGREAETLTDEWVKFLEDKAQQPPQPSPEEQKVKMEMAAKQQEMAGKQQDRAAELQFKQQEHQMEMQAKQEELQFKREELELKRQEMALKQQAAQQEHAFQMQAAQEQAAFDSQNRAKDAEFEDERRTSELAFMKQKQAQQPSRNGAQA